MHVVLFDIDGTLLAGAGAGRNALEDAFFALYGKRLEIAPHRLSGRTDRGITLELLREHRLVAPPLEEPAFHQVMDEYTIHLQKRLLQAPGTLLPGVSALIDCLRTKPKVAMGLLTGNSKLGAWHKLAMFGLQESFSFGGFGDSHEDRDDVAREALASLDPATEPKQVWVIGDTPLDIRCARAIGAKVLAVATGCHPMAELATHQPDLLLENLADTKAVVRALLNSHFPSVLPAIG